MTTTAPRGVDTTTSGPGPTHFHQLSSDVLDHLFLHRPEAISGQWPTQRIAVALGATLYVPATRPDLAAVIERRHREGVISMVIDLEDAIADHQSDEAIAATVRALRHLEGTAAGEMLLFVRVRHTSQIETITSMLDSAGALSGFVLPKFTAAEATTALEAVRRAGTALGGQLWAMPVLESAALVHRETRDDELLGIAQALDEYRATVLAVRIGATDMCGLFGIRRARDLTIYDVRVAADAIASVVNILGRAEDGHIITGPVWEYFADHERLFVPQLRTTPFRDHDAVLFRQQLVSHDLDGLLREIALDRANGMHGKTVIHPAHAGPVHALSVVTHEEYRDALDILAVDAGGVAASSYRNKMNEMKPHRNWAMRVMDRAAAFGVTAPGVNFVDLLTAVDAA
ncbi:HpcH/HpaI aldolase/citrate lyase family protein [Gordonia sp. DT30]|uniref:HpcH/HpaI aldolase/citrate lyase family protein n=1 Tax=unclassified Gordonia (in: high G+C Gram-positive bacteria) TaxID=2657482 RepID=UPI003CEC707D